MLTQCVWISGRWFLCVHQIPVQDLSVLASLVSSDVDPYLKALFPGITISGIDKAAALEWIDRLEEVPRGLYAGALGWIDAHGAADFAISIRSVFQYHDQVRLNAGAGIIAESDPYKEYQESVNKMNTMLHTLILAE